MQQGYPAMGLPFSNNTQMPQAFGKGGRVFKKILPALVRTAATVIGTMYGGPAGGTAAASLASGIMEKTKGGKFGKGMLKGAIHGGVQAYGLPYLGNSLGVSPQSTAGSFMGMGTPKYGNIGSSLLGGANSGRAGAFNALQNVGKGSAPGAGGLGSLLTKDNINKALLGTTILGTLGAKYKTPKGPTLQDAINNGPKWAPEDYPRQMKPIERSLRHFDPNNYTPGFSPEQLYFDDVNPLAQYATGGHVHTFEGEGGGQSDQMPVYLQPGSYVVDSSATSDLGDGNPQAGAEQIEGLVNEAMQGNHYKKGGRAQQSVPALVSPTEVNISKEAVDAIGGGNNAKGAEILKNMVKNVRKHKRSNPKGLPPKAKPIKAYLGGK
jgi:hypothetical protein